MHRFFVLPAALVGQPVMLTGDQAHQVRRVLRLRPGEQVTLLDGCGWAYEAVLVAYGSAVGAVPCACPREEARFELVRRYAATGEPRTQITLFQAVLKGERFGWALQKGTEVGISRFVPLICARNVVDDLDAVEGKRERWVRIIREAAEQSGRARLPELAPTQRFAQAVQPDRMPAEASAASLLRLMAWEGERAVGLREALISFNLADAARIQLLVGPEGGFTDDEVQLARRYDVQPVSLGPRILRAETAGIVAAAVILYEAGDL